MDKHRIMFWCWVLLTGVNVPAVSSEGDFTIQSVRLANGMSPNEGRVEFQIVEGDEGPYWGVACDHHWGLDEARWVCRRLGYFGAAVAPTGSRFGRGALPFVYKQLAECDVGESWETFLECERDEEVSGCTAAAGAICHKPDYIGCVRTGPKELEDVRIGQEYDQDTTNDQCIERCRGVSGAVLAFQREDRCHCLIDFNERFEAVSDDDCNIICSESPDQICGGGRDRYSAFNVNIGVCPPFPDSVLIVSGGRRFGDVVTLSCQPGLRLRGASSLQCIGDPQNAQTVYAWNGQIPYCEAITSTARTTISMGLSDNPTTKNLGYSQATLLMVTGTLVTNNATARQGRTFPPTIDNEVVGGALSSSSARTALKVVGVVVLLVLLIVLIVVVVKIRKKSRSNVKQEPEPTKIKERFDNLSYGMHTIPSIAGPGYYEVGPGTGNDVPNSPPKSTEASPNRVAEGVLVENELYRPSDVPTSSDGNAIAPNLTRYTADDLNNGGVAEGELIDNILYNASEGVRGTPNSTETSPNDDECVGEGMLVENVLYKPSDGPSTSNHEAATPGYYEVADAPSNKTHQKYYEIPPNIPKEHGNSREAIVEDAPNSPSDRLFFLHPEVTSSQHYDYATVDQQPEPSPKPKKAKPFPPYAKVKK